jgi:nitrite reductase (NADH) large subunit
MKRHLVVVGNGMAGLRFLEELAALEHGYQVTVLGAEPDPAYNRIQLSHVLAGEGEEGLALQPRAWYAEQGFDLRTGAKVDAIDVAGRTLSVGGETLAWDRLVLATGSLPILLPLPGAEKAGVIAFRDKADCAAMQAAAAQGGEAVVIGGGLLGLEAARGLLNLGMPTTVVHLMPSLMERQLDPAAGGMLREDLEGQGMRFVLGGDSARVLGDGHVQGLELKDGRVLPCRLLVMAVGIRPNAVLAAAAGLAVKRGIVVDDQLRTSDPAVWAVGECAEHRGMAYGLVAPLYEQAKVLAQTLTGEAASYEGSVVHTKLKVAGLDVFSAGDLTEKPGDAVLVHKDDFNRRYARVVLRAGRLAGAILYGDTAASGALLGRLRGGATAREDLRPLLAPVGAGAPVALVTEQPADFVVCNCNGVTKGAIEGAIRDQACQSVGAVTRCTKAGGSCGGCKADVAALLGQALGGQVKADKATVCGCTDLDRDELVEAIKAKGLRHGQEVRAVLGFRTLEGCSKCRPAINYYLNMLWPVEHEDEVESRFVNERLHANIQKDGTFSVIPRIYGGVTSAAELKRIAEVAERFQIPTVKLTGGQRIDLLGVQKKDLPAVWEALDMPSGSAYGKALRTVKTCVGSEWCRFGVGDSTTLGIDLEKKLERLNTPAKVKLAVSGCPRNCAECGIKDVGVVAVEGGAWDVFVGGNGGVKIREAELLARCGSPAEVLRLTLAFLQHYREDAKWNERTAAWVERKGLDAVKAVVLDEAQQPGLVARIEQALAVLEDPWLKARRDPSLWTDPIAMETPSRQRVAR